MPPKLNSDAGVSLIEMVVAVLVLSIGVVAGFQSLSQSRIAIGGELPRVYAQTVALNRAEEFQLLGAAAASGLPKQVVLAGLPWTVDIDTEPTEGGFVEARIHVTGPDQPGAILVVYAPVEPPQ